MPQPLARPLRFVGGIGGYLLLSLVPAPWSFVAGLFVVASVIATLTTPQGRGLPGIVSGQRVTDAREPAGAEPMAGSATTAASGQEPAAK